MTISLACIACLIRSVLACKLSLDLFASRCWSNGSLIRSPIGLDHLASVTKRFYNRPSEAVLCDRVQGWVRSVNLDTISLLDEVIHLSACANGSMGTDIHGAISALRERESRTRQQLLSEGATLREELKALRLSHALQPRHAVPTRLKLARQAAVAVLAIGMPALSGCQSGVSEMAPPPLKGEQVPAQDNRCSLVGDVTDPQGAVIANATITITNIDTNFTRTVKTNEVGHYVAGGLKVGHYTVKAKISRLQGSREEWNRIGTRGQRPGRCRFGDSRRF